MSKVRLRFAPSPTGYLHIGGLRTALYSYLYAKQNDGKYILRVEDTDQTRLVKGATKNLVDALTKVGVMHEEGVFVDDDGNVFQKGEFGPYIQSERLDIYKEHVQKLIDSGDAYYCFCSKERLDDVREKQKAANMVPRYDGKCRNLSKEEAEEKIANGEEFVIRMRLPKNKEFKFNDPIRGEISFNSNDVDDQVLMKSDGFPTYHLAVVVDDHLMEISHAFRGEEWLSSTPKQLFLYEAFGWEAPVFAHLPTILNKEKKKLSKRHGDVAVKDFFKKGYLKEGLINYIALVGWSPDSNQEIFTMEELVKEFDLARVSKSGGIFDVNKLNWVNNKHIKNQDISYITDLSLPYLKEAKLISESFDREKLEEMINVVRDGVDYLSQMPEKLQMFLEEKVEPENEEAEKMLKGDHTETLLKDLKEKVQEADVINDDFANSIFKKLQNDTGIKGKNLYMTVRVALTGQCHGPEMTDTIKILGREKILKRIDSVLL